MPKVKKPEADVRGGLAALMDMVRSSVDSNEVIVSTAVEMYRNQKWIPMIDPYSGRPCIALEWMLGSRGIPVGRLAQLRASFSAGKSSFLYYVYACATYGRSEEDVKAWIGHIETEGAPNPPDYIARFGVDPEAFLCMTANSLGSVFTTLDSFLCSVRGGFGGSIGDTGRVRKTVYTNPLDKENRFPIILGVDSFSALGDQKEASQDVLDINKSQAMAYISRELRRYLRERQQRYSRADATLFVTSLETAKVAQGPAKFAGPQKSALAQEALGGAISLGIDVSDRKWNDSGTTKGSVQSMKTFKNKFAPRYRPVDLFRKDLGGYDIVETDVNFFLTHPASPFAAGGVFNKEGGRVIWRDVGGIHCPMLRDKGYKDKSEFLEDIYGNEDILLTIMDSLRIRGYNLDFETKFDPMMYASGEVDDAQFGIPNENPEPSVEEDEEQT